jgi:hypothetical protein
LSSLQSQPFFYNFPKVNLCNAAHHSFLLKLCVLSPDLACYTCTRQFLFSKKTNLSYSSRLLNIHLIYYGSAGILLFRHDVFLLSYIALWHQYSLWNDLIFLLAIFAYWYIIYVDLWFKKYHKTCSVYSHVFS